MDQVNNDSRTRVAAYQYIRLIAMALVVVGHTSTLALPLSGGGKIDPYYNVAPFAQYALEQLRLLIYSFHMPLFVILSGAVFELGRERKDRREWIVGRAKKLMIPFVLTAVFLLFPIRFLFGYYPADVSGGVLLHIIYNDFLLGYDLNFLWYVLMLFEVDVVVFILWRPFSSRGTLTQFVMLGALLIVASSYSLGAGMPFQFHQCLYHLIWFYLGMLLERNRWFLQERTKTLHIVLLVLIWISVYFVYTYLEKMIAHGGLQGMAMIAIKFVKMGFRYIRQSAGSLAVIVFAFRRSGKINGFLSYIDSRSFQIYLFHYPVQYFLLYYIVHRYISPDIMAVGVAGNMIYFGVVLCVLVLSVAGSLLIDAVLRKASKAFA